MRLFKHNGEGRVKTFSPISPAASFHPVISKLQYIINDNLTFPILRFFFIQTLLSGRWPSVLKFFSDHSMYSSESFSIPTPVIRALSPTKKHEKK